MHFFPESILKFWRKPLKCSKYVEQKRILLSVFKKGNVSSLRPNFECLFNINIKKMQHNFEKSHVLGFLLR